MTMKGYFTVHGALKLEPDTQIQFSAIPRTHLFFSFEEAVLNLCNIEY